MFEEFDRGVSLRDIVTDILRDGHASISQVGAELKKRGIRLHRLAVAGYLKALADDGYLDERVVPPAKTYRLNPAQSARNVYEVVADKVRQQAAPHEAPRIALQVLVDLFQRPIFREEFRRTGFEAHYGAREVTGEDRQAARRILSKTPLKLPFNDPAYVPEPADPADAERLRVASRHVITSILRDDFGVQALAMTTKQSTLVEVD